MLFLLTVARFHLNVITSNQISKKSQCQFAVALVSHVLHHQQMKTVLHTDMLQKASNLGLRFCYKIFLSINGT